MEFVNPLVALIDRNALKNNIDFIRKLHPDKEIILPVKANGYGHDDVLIVNEAVASGVNMFAVARVDEGVTLREKGVVYPILILGVEHGENVKLAIKHSIELSVSDLANLVEIESFAREVGVKVKVHILVDTGMSRMGVELSELKSIIQCIKKSEYLHLSSVFTHFARSDESVFSIKEQLVIFENARTIFLEQDLIPDFFHCSNSGGIENYNGPDWTNAVRPGIMVYGYSQKIGGSESLIPVMTLTAKVIHCKDVKKNRAVGYGHTFITSKDVRLATISIGYADGLPRICSNNLVVRINGKDYKQCGRISMDLTVVEVDKKVNVGDTVYIFGSPKYAPLNANDIANRSGTISYEILTGIGDRCSRKIV